MSSFKSNPRNSFYLYLGDQKTIASQIVQDTTMEVISVYSKSEPELKETSNSLTIKIDDDKRSLRISKDLIPGVLNDNKNIY